ncbi:MAG: AAA family ATPase [Burkholderiaceae bacterium]|nr:AAA family ATPase [Burkholderiaceae bacterium]
MYAPFFGLKHEPFSIAPDPRYLFMSERHREALAHLLYGVKGGGGGFVLLTGEIGAGKTTVCRCLLEQVPRRCNVAYIFNPKLTALELLKTVCDEFHVPYRHEGAGQPTVKDYLDPLNDFLLRTHAIGLNNVLIIDEAQNLSAGVLEQLRLLTNLETNRRKLLQIVLIGQPELRTMLARPGLEQLTQRVIARYHLDALSEDETAKYLRHRLGVAGLATANPFSRRAMRRIHQRARGVPRRINLLADRALLGAYADGVARVDQRIVDKAAAEVFGPDERLQRLRRMAPWGIGVAVGAVLAASATLWLTSDRPGAVAGAASAAAARASKPAAAPTALPGASSLAAPASARASGAVAGHAGPIFVTAADLSTRFSNPLRREVEAWRELAPWWPGGPDAGAADPCAPTPPSTWSCFKSDSGGLPLVRQLDRPGIVTLRDEAGRPVHALLVAIDEHSATLHIGGQRAVVALVSLANLWQGDFATFWQAPTGYQRVIGDGDSGALVDQLAGQLAALRGDKPPAGAQRFDAALKSRVQAFQLAQGLKPDGVAGPTTYMQLARALVASGASGALNEPRLASGH